MSGAVLRRLARARGRALKALRGDQRPVAKHVEALWHLVVDPSRSDLQQARGLLEEAIFLSPHDAAVHNDLTVVLLALSVDDATTLPAALEHARTARALRPDDPTTHWNAALVAQAFPLPHVARRDWEIYQALSDDPGWAAEASLRRERIVFGDQDLSFRVQFAVPPASEEAARALVRDYPDRATGYLLEKLLPDWAYAVKLSDSDAARNLLQSSMLVAEALYDVLADDGGREAMAWVATQPSAMGALEAYAHGRAALLRDDLSAAETALREILHQEPEPTNPHAAWSRVWLALIAIYRGSHDQTDMLLATVERSIDLERQPTLAGRVLWHRGLSLTRRGLDASSVPTFRKAETLFTRLRDRRSAASIQLMLSEDLAALGRPAEAWDLRLRALRGLVRHPRSIPLHNTLLNIAEAAQENGRPRTARAFAEEAVTLADATEDPISIADARELVARLAAAEGRLDEAAQHLAHADAAATRIDDEDFRRDVTADIALVRAAWLPELGAGTEPFAPLLDFYRSRSLHHQVIAVLLARARHRRSANDAEGAARDLETALTLLVDKNRTLEGVGDRLAHTEVVQAVLEALIAHHIDRGDAITALAYLECARLAPYRLWAYPRLGLPLDADCRVLTSGLDARHTTLERGETWLVYFSRSDELLVWILDGHGIRLDRQPVKREDIGHRVDTVVQSIERGDDGATRAAGEALWPLLRLQHGTGSTPSRLVVVPDGILAHLPFAALHNPSSGRWLVEDTVLSLAVQVAPRIESSEFSDGDATDSAVLVADPAFDPGFVDLLPLRYARAEIEAIAVHVAAPRLLAGAEATREAILDTLRGATLFHYAGHAVANASDPFRSYLVLAAAGVPPTQQLLRADELIGVDMPALRLVVLSACETAAVPARRTAPAAGLAGLAMPFLLRSIADVVATLRPVDDHSTARLMPHFYRHRAAGQPAAHALRAAQLDLLYGDDLLLRQPAAWAWMVVVE